VTSCCVTDRTYRKVEDYSEDHGVLVDLPTDDRQASIGCTSCARPAVDDGDSRSGRWSGYVKTGCGRRAQ